jgi:hypothetical protein
MVSHFVVSGVEIYYEPELDGGGRSFGMLYVPIVRRVVGHAKRCLEAFSGPGFIGFSLVAHGLCDELVLADAVFYNLYLIIQLLSSIATSAARYPPVRAPAWTYMAAPALARA